MFSAPGKTTKKAQREPSGVQGLIDNLEKEIEHTRSKLKRIRRTTAKLEFEEKVLRKSSSASAKLVERSLLHSRVVERLQIMYDEEDTFRSSHEVILDDHKAKIEAQKAELSEKLDKMYAASLEKLKSSAQDGAPPPPFLIHRLLNLNVGRISNQRGLSKMYNHTAVREGSMTMTVMTITTLTLTVTIMMMKRLNLKAKAFPTEDPTLV